MALGIVKRHEKVAFMEVKTKGSGTKIVRMKGFTALSTKSNAKEYSRQYVDEPFETTDVVGISVSQDFDFDQTKGNEVSDFLVDIIENEKLGADAIVNIIQVDFTSPVASEDGYFHAVKRAFSVVADSRGDGTDAYKYSGTFKVAGDRIAGKANTSDKWETITFTEV